MAESNDIQQRILDTAKEHFYAHGFSRVRVDDIATKLGISKKTFYKLFPSKNDLVKSVADRAIKEMDLCYAQILDDENVEFVEKLQRLMSFVGLQYAKMGKPLVEDLQKKSPQIWEKIARHRAERIMKVFGELLSEGIRKGIFRNDIDRDLVLLIYSNAIENIINPEMLTRIPFTAAQVFDTIVKVIFEGILTSKSKQQFQKQHHPLSRKKQNRTSI